jgi:hypothetical protein
VSKHLHNRELSQFEVTDACNQDDRSTGPVDPPPPDEDFLILHGVVLTPGRDCGPLIRHIQESHLANRIDESYASPEPHDPTPPEETENR